MLLQEREAARESYFADQGEDITLRRYEVRRRILMVARHRFARFGYELVSLEDIASSADLDWDDLPLFFRSKRALLDAILDEGWEDLLSRTESIAATSLTAYSTMLGMLALMCGILQKDEDLFRLMLLEGRRPDPDGGHFAFSSGYQRFMQVCRDLVLRGQRDGSFRSSFHPHVATSMVIGAFEGMLRDRLVAGQERDTTPYTGSYMMTALDALMSSLKS